MNNFGQIENFIREHRLDFDTAMPGILGWQGIEKALDRLRCADRLEQEVLSNRLWLDVETPGSQVWSGIERWLDQSCVDSDPLERFIARHREDLDTQAPDLQVWANILRSVPAPAAKVVRINWQRTLLRAAASVALLLTGLGLGMWYTRSSETPVMAMGEVSVEYAELERYYQREITGKQQKLANFTGSQPAEVHDDLEQLDHVMTELKRELADVPAGNREQVVRAMIENYKAKTAILERVLERLEQSTKTETKNSDTGNEIKNI